MCALPQPKKSLGQCFLTDEIIAAMDTQQAIRVLGQQESGLLAVGANESWQDTASRQAGAQVLRQTESLSACPRRRGFAILGFFTSY